MPTAGDGHSSDLLVAPLMLHCAADRDELPCASPTT
jgi:hypothetical protein